jgi:deoxyribose-phosphate aldolase
MSAAIEHPVYTAVARMFDHTILKPEATPKDVEKICREAREYGTRTVCIRPSDVKQAVSLLKDTKVGVCTVIGFPHGTTTTATKVAEALEAVESGATEIDMVLHVGNMKAGDHEYCGKDIKAVCDAVKGKAIVKVIFETCLLNDEEKKIACKLSAEGGAHFVKTSTGFSTGGATVPDLKLMKTNIPATMEVKASGGIRTLDAVLEARAAGATRVGASASVAVLEELKKRIHEAEAKGEAFTIPEVGSGSAEGGKMGGGY